MTLTLDELLLQLRQYGIILISPEEVWPSPFVTQELYKTLRRHRRGLRVLMTWSSVTTCSDPGLHRQYWRYAGESRFICSACETLLSEVS